VLETTTEGVVDPVEEADENAPLGVFGFTPLNDIAPPTILFAADKVTTMFAVPEAGPANLHISTRTCAPLSAAAPTKVRLAAPYFTLVTVTLELRSATPTIKIRFDAEPTV
jgi:hypothetical protein